MTAARKTHVRVAVTQAEPVWLDLEATVEKTCGLIAEAAENGAEVVTFPECWIPGYPAWIWSRPVDSKLHTEYILNSFKVDSPQMRRIQDCAAKNKIIVVLGFSENRHHSLYISQAIIDSAGQILTTRSKIKATHMERTIFGDASAECLDTVTDTPVGRIGALSCWEHTQPLLKYHTYAQREQIHVAAWPPLFTHTGGEDLWSMSQQGKELISRVLPGTQAIASTYAIESQAFVLHTTAVISQTGIDRMQLQPGSMMSSPGGGNSAIFGPDGRKLSTDLPGAAEGIIYATLDLEDVLKSRAFIDVCGHYSRPDILWLGVDKDVKKWVREQK